MADSDLLANFRLDGRFIIVTGASGGLGRMFAETFAALGARVLLAARRREKLEEVRDAIASAGGKAEFAVVDLYRLADIRMLAAAVERLSHPEEKLVLVNNAGFSFTKPVLEVTEADWDTLIDVHLKGTFFCSQQIGAMMIARGYGKIINLSSTWAAATAAGKSVYCTAKAGIGQLSAALSSEWAPRGVRVNALAPTATLTDAVKRNKAADPARHAQLLSRIKLGRFAEPGDLIGGAIFLASAASDFVTGQTLFVDGGFTT